MIKIFSYDVEKKGRKKLINLTRTEDSFLIEFEVGFLDKVVRNRKISVDKDTIVSKVGTGVIVDHTVLSFALTTNLDDIIVFNKHEKTIQGKIPGELSRYGVPLLHLFDIYIPFKDSPFTDWVFRLIGFDTENLPDFGVEVFVGTIDEVKNKLFALLPTINTYSVIDCGDHKEITFEVTRNGFNVKKSGIELYFKTNAGYLNKTKITTDEEGKVVLRARRDLLDPQDRMEIKAGFKFFSNKVSLDV